MSDYSNDPHQNPYWQNINRQNGGDSAGRSTQGWENRQDTRNTDPNWHPEDNLGIQLARTAQTIGIFALISGLMIPIVMPAILAGIAIVLAILSKGRKSSMTKRARNAVIMGIVTLAINTALLGMSVFQIYRAMTDEETMDEFNELMEDNYGYSFEDLLESYGVTLGEETT